MICLRVAALPSRPVRRLGAGSGSGARPLLAGVAFAAVAWADPSAVIGPVVYPESEKICLTPLDCRNRL